MSTALSTGCRKMANMRPGDDVVNIRDDTSRKRGLMNTSASRLFARSKFEARSMPSSVVVSTLTYRTSSRTNVSSFCVKFLFSFRWVERFRLEAGGAGVQSASYTMRFFRCSNIKRGIVIFRQVYTAARIENKKKQTHFLVVIGLSQSEFGRHYQIVT